MILRIVNPSSDVLSYVEGLVTVPAYGSFDVPQGFWIRLYDDITFVTDIRNSNLIINDGVTDYKYPDSEDIVRDAIKNIRFTSIRKDFSSSNSQTNTTLWAPTTGKKYVITDYTIHIRNNTLGAITLTLFDETNSTGNILYKASFEAGSNYDVVCNLKTPFISGAINRSLKVTISGSLNASGSISGYETE